MLRFRFSHLKLLSIALAFLTGFTALIFQNTWHRYLNYLLGSQSQATAMILAVFLGGMSIGYFLYGHLSQKFPHHLFKIYGATEIFIGVWAIFSPAIFQIIFEVKIDGFLTELGLSLVLIGLPTILMGGTIPVLTQALSQDLNSATRVHSQIYAFNTFGAALGSFVAGFYLLPTLGLPLSLFYMGLINVLTGIIFYSLENFLWKEKTILSEPASPVEKTEASPFKWVWVVVFISGFVTLGLEVLLIRLVGLSIGASSYAFSIIVGIFVFCIALGGWVVGTFKKISIQAIGFLLGLTGISLLLLYRSIETWPYYSYVIRALFSRAPHAFSIYHATVSLVIAGALLVPILLCGSALPLCFNFVKRSFNSLGSKAGSLYAVNTLGCALGSLLAGYYLLFWFNISEIFLFLIYLIAFSGILSLGFSWKQMGKSPQLGLLAVFLVFLVALSQQSPWDNQRFSKGTFRSFGTLSPTFELFKVAADKLPLMFYRDGPSATVSVIGDPIDKKERTENIAILVNGKVDAHTSGDLVTMQLTGHIPILFAENPEKVCVIGFGSGVTAGVAGLYKDVRKIDLVEINPAVIEAGRLFQTFNYQALTNPKIRVLLSDAFRHFRNVSDPYDVIISEPSNPWMVGVENLYTREFYQLANSRLSENGVFLQWFHGYSFSLKAAALVLNTFRSIFPYYHVFNFQNTDFAILGSKTPIDYGRLKIMEQRLERESENHVLKDFGATNIESFLALKIISGKAVDKFAEHGGWHTLENPKLGYWAGRDFFMKSNAPLNKVGRGSPFIVSEVSLLNRWEKTNRQKKEIQLPKNYCKRNLPLCKKLELRNYLLDPESPKSIKYFADSSEVDQTVLSYILKKETPSSISKEKAKKLVKDIQKHASRFFSPSALVNLEKHQKAIGVLNAKIAQTND